MKQLEVKIMGQSYLLRCPIDGDARMLDAVQRVDSAMCKIRDAGKVKARDRIAVLAALNLAFELVECKADSFAGLSELAALQQGILAAIPIPTHLPVLTAMPASKSIQEDAALQATPQLAVLLQRLDVVLGADARSF